jgi:hypothetical protein
MICPFMYQGSNIIGVGEQEKTLLLQKKHRRHRQAESQVMQGYLGSGFEQSWERVINASMGLVGRYPLFRQQMGWGGGNNTELESDQVHHGIELVHLAREPSISENFQKINLVTKPRTHILPVKEVESQEPKEFLNSSRGAQLDPPC